MTYSAVVQPNAFIALRLPSGTLNVIEVVPNTVISIGKFGALPSNMLIGRPVYTTYEILEQASPSEDNKIDVRLRIVPPSEIHEEAAADDGDVTLDPNADGGSESATGTATPDAVADAAFRAVKNNRLTIDDPLRQTLTTNDIEELKKADNTSGRDIIRKIMEAHTNLSEKTAFSLAKYTLRKTRKYIRRFTVLPLDVGTLTQWLLLDKDPARILEIRQETLGLVNAWANIHHSPEARSPLSTGPTVGNPGAVGCSRYLVMDDVGGLLVASIAERLGILYPNTVASSTASLDADEAMPDADENSEEPAALPSKKRRHATVSLAPSNTIHLVHQNAQPNLSLLKYFGYDTNNPSATHPLHSHLKTLTWLQLVDPKGDSTYTEPASAEPSELSSWKSGKRGQYFRKRRRWERCRLIVDETRAGGFDGLIVASTMQFDGVLSRLVPLVRGGGTVVVFSPNIEPLAALVDCYSKERRAAFLSRRYNEEGVTADGEQGDELSGPDPRLLLTPAVYTSRIRPWQALPGRTHPIMALKGGAEGFVFAARRVVPVEGRVEARGNFSKKRVKLELGTEA